jgi:hypothetical protein
MKIVYKTKKIDNDHPYWRLSFSVDLNSGSQNIVVKIENYKWGFLDGEDWDKIFVYRRYSDYAEESLLVSIMTKDSYEYLMSRYNEVLEAFYQNILEVIEIKHKKFKIEKSNYEKNISLLNQIESSDLFLSIKRHEKLNILDEN